MKSLIKPRGGLVRWLVTRPSSLIRYSAPSRHRARWSRWKLKWADLFTRLFAWYLMSIIGTPRLGTTVTTDPASQPAWRQWELRFRKLAASPSPRLGEIREISCVIRESWEEAGEEANKNTFIFQSDDFLSSNTKTPDWDSLYYCCYLSIFVIMADVWWLVGGVRSAGLLGLPIRQSDVMVVLSWYYRHYASLFFTMLD